MRAIPYFLLITSAVLILSAKAVAATTTIVPISAELSTGIAADLFPVTIKLAPGNLFLTEPVLRFLDDGRIGMQVRFQVYDHRPAQNIAMSEMGRAVLSGRIAYDVNTRQILLHDPIIDALEFDQTNAVTRRLTAQLKEAWSTQATNPIRADLPPHPYLIPFKNNIQGLSCDGTNLNLILAYE